MGLAATVQPQVWIDDHAINSGSSIEFDAEAAMLGLPAERFRSYASEILDGGFDLDDLALDAGVIDEWLNKGMDNTFQVSVDEDDFREWLASLVIDEADALAMTDENLAGLRAIAALAATP